MQIRYLTKAIKARNKLPKNDRVKVTTAINKLVDQESKSSLDIKKLQGRNGFRLRVGRYRVIYDINGTIFDIEDIFHRQKNYKH